MEVEYNKGFESLFESTAELIVRSLDGYPNSVMSSAALLQSALLLEAAANCCLYELKLPGKITEELDRLSTFAKFDLFLLIKSAGSKYLNRGDTKYQRARELKRLRDLAVHPKRTKITWREIDEENGVGEHENSPILGISLDYGSWSPEDSVLAFKVVNQFLEEYLVDLCGIKDRELRLLLFAPISDEPYEDIWVSSDYLERLQREFNISLEYAGVGVLDDEE